jgi:uncharacterized membrane protein YeaQ/YmgE (transglycosylase-associated protein family)
LLENKFLILLAIGFLAGWLVGIVVFSKEEKIINKLIVSVISGIFGAYVGTTTIGESFLISTLRILGETLVNIAKNSSKLLVCGVVFIPTFFSALGFALAISLFIKVFRSKE